MMNDTQPMTNTIPMRFRKRVGKAIMIHPDGSRVVRHRGITVDTKMIKALARAYRWHLLLSDGTNSSMDELAEAEKINSSYLSRITRLAYLSPTIIEAILQGEHPPSLTLKDLMAPFPLEWGAQERLFLRQDESATRADTDVGADDQECSTGSWLTAGDQMAE